jgi:hypothetical protein
VNDLARRDAGAIVMGWLAKIALVLTLVGIAGFDAVSVGAGHVSTTDDANSAASAASADYQTSHSLQSALAAAQDVITNPNETLLPKSLTISPDGSATVTVERKITTLVMYRIGPLKKYTVVQVSGQAPAPTQ